MKWAYDIGDSSQGERRQRRLSCQSVVMTTVQAQAAVRDSRSKADPNANCVSRALCRRTVSQLWVSFDWPRFIHLVSLQSDIGRGGRCDICDDMRDAASLVRQATGVRRRWRGPTRTRAQYTTRSDL